MTVPLCFAFGLRASGLDGNFLVWSQGTFLQEVFRAAIKPQPGPRRLWYDSRHGIAPARPGRRCIRQCYGTAGRTPARLIRTARLPQRRNWKSGSSVGRWVPLDSFGPWQDCVWHSQALSCCALQLYSCRDALSIGAHDSPFDREFRRLGRIFSLFVCRYC